MWRHFWGEHENNYAGSYDSFMLNFISSSSIGKNSFIDRAVANHEVHTRSSEQLKAIYVSEKKSLMHR